MIPGTGGLEQTHHEFQRPVPPLSNPDSGRSRRRHWSRGQRVDPSINPDVSSEQAAVGTLIDVLPDSFRLGQREIREGPMNRLMERGTFTPP